MQPQLKCITIMAGMHGTMQSPLQISPGQLYKASRPPRGVGEDNDDNEDKSVKAAEVLFVVIVVALESPKISSATVVLVFIYIIFGNSAQ